MDTVYEDTCILHCTDTGKDVEVEIMGFAPEKGLTVAVNRAVKVHLEYNKQFKEYQGNMSGLEFTTAGPKGRDVGRTRHF